MADTIDLSKVKRNVSKMVSMNAPEEDIDSYIASEGTSIDAIKNFKESTNKKSQSSIPEMIIGNLVTAAKGTGEAALKAGNEALFGLPGIAYKGMTGQNLPESNMDESTKQMATGAAIVGPSPISAIAKKTFNLIKPILKFENSLVQAQKSKVALDEIRTNLGKGVEVAIHKIENVPTGLDMTIMPEKVLSNIKKRVYGIELQAKGEPVNTIGNLRKLKEATYDMLTSKDFVEASRAEKSEILRFAGKVSQSMRDAARTAGKPIDNALDSYGKFMDRYNTINTKLVNRLGDAEGNKLKEIFKLTGERNTKEAWRELAKSDPELKSVMGSMNRRELLKNLVAASAGSAALGLTTKAAFSAETTPGRDQIKTDEGFRGKIYRDTVGVPTVGYGFNINDPTMRRLMPKDVLSGKRELSKSEADVIFSKRYEIAENDAMKYLGEEKFNDLSKSQKDVVTNMSYAMGINRLSGFKRLKKALVDGNYDKASEEILNSKWAKQVGGRAKRLANAIKS